MAQILSELLRAETTRIHLIKEMLFHWKLKNAKKSILRNNINQKSEMTRY